MAMTEAQAEVIDTLDECCCVVSIPGSGKTTVITHKIANILRSRPSRRVTAVSFTAEAARELKTRTLELVPEEDRPRLTTGTFHSLVLRALRRTGHEASKRKIAPEGTCRQYFERAVLLATGEDTMDLEQPTWAETCRMKSAGSYSGGEKGEVQKRAVDRYHSMMKAANLVDFGELMQIALGLCEQDTLLLGQPGDQLLVDEAQDIDELQLSMILEHQGRGVIVDLVGDDDQSIYAFRMGLGIEGMERFKDFADAKELHLDTNFRCRPAILAWAGQVVEQNLDGRIAKELKAARAEGGTVSFRSAERADVEEAWVFKQLQTLFRKRAGTVAIIARQNHFLQRYELVLKGGTKQDSIPTKRLSGSSVWDEGPVCMFVALLVAIQNWRSPAGFEQFLYWMEVRASVIQELSQEFGPKLLRALDVDLEKSRCEAWGSSTEKVLLGARKAVEWRGRLGNSPDDEATSALIREVCAWCVSYAEGKGKNKKREMERLKTISLLPMVANTLCKFKGSVATRMAAISKLDSGGDTGEWAVRLVSMHGCKGLEFDSVFVVGCEQGTIPGQSSEVESLVAEERRLLYVAMTRAKDHLTVTHALQYPVRRSLEDKVKKTTACEFLLMPGMMPAIPLEVTLDT